MALSDYIGKNLTDTVTGFTGRCIGVVSYETGVDQVLIQPKARDGAFVAGQWIDIARIEIVQVDV